MNTCPHTTHQAGCTPCQTRSAANARRHRQRQRNGQHLPQVDADLIRAHLHHLRTAGMSLTRIADTARLSHSSIKKLSAGLQQRVHGATAAAILAVQPAPRPRVNAVPVAGPARRIRALCTLGWSLTEQARRAGTSTSALWVIAHHEQATVTNHLAARIVAMYDDLYATDPPDTSSSRAVRDIARHYRWCGPEAWTDATIDDPATQPHGHTIVDDVAVDQVLAGARRYGQLAPADKVEAYRRLHSQGASDTQIRRRLHINTATLNRLATACEVAARQPADREAAA